MIEKFSTLLPRDGQGKRILKSKLLTALGATGVLAPYPQNPEHILERKILLQKPFNTQPPPAPVVPSNALLTSLQTYWTMDEAGPGTRFDSSANGLNLTDNNGNLQSQPGIINAAAVCSQTLVTNALLHAANAAFVMGAGVSFTFSAWVRNNAFIAGSPILCNWNVATAYYLGESGGNIVWECTELGTLTQRILIIAATAAFGLSFHHIVVGYDASIQKIFTQFDNGARAVTACADVNSANNAFTVGNYASLASPSQFFIDETGFWRRALTTAEVTKLYNGGAGLPFGSFS